MAHHQEKESVLLKELIAQFLNLEANTKSVITVTDCSISSDSKKATIYITVLPETMEKEALNFAKRQRPAMRDFIKQKARLKTLPFIEVEIDQGEKNRPRIEGLLKSMEPPYLG